MTTIAMEWPDTKRPEKWTVQRAGTRGHWLPGWFAFSPAYMDQSAWFATHDEALAFAINRAIARAQSDERVDALARWGIAHEPQLAGRKKRLQPADLARLEDAYRDGAKVSDLAVTFGVTIQTIYTKLRLRGFEFKRGGRHASTH